VNDALSSTSVLSPCAKRGGLPRLSQLRLLLLIHGRAEFAHADVEASNDGPDGRPGRCNLAALNPTIGAERQVSNMADALLAVLNALPDLGKSLIAADPDIRRGCSTPSASGSRSTAQWSDTPKSAGVKRFWRGDESK
jgi:hypothetical protein